MSAGRGRFITLEGGEGAGKTTSMEFLRERLEQAGKPVLVTREPGGTVLGEEIRNILLNPKARALGTDAELLLMFAARAQHLEEVVAPSLERGTWVLCDRFTDASYAYQGGGRGVADERIAVLENWVQGSLRPDLTLLFDLPVLEGLERAGRRSDPDRFEQAGVEFLERVRRYYLAAAEREPQRIKVIDASATPENVRAQLTAVIGPLLV